MIRNGFVKHSLPIFFTQRMCDFCFKIVYMLPFFFTQRMRFFCFNIVYMLMRGDSSSFRKNSLPLCITQYKKSFLQAARTYIAFGCRQERGDTRNFERQRARRLFEKINILQRFYQKCALLLGAQNRGRLEDLFDSAVRLLVKVLAQELVQREAGRRHRRK